MRLFEYQCKLASGPVYLSLPQDYQILPVDQSTIERLGIHIIRPDNGLSLADSVLFALGEIGQAEAVEILFGDTLVQGRATAAAWFDFGHLALYYQSKREFAVARAFNSLQPDGITVRKSSNQTNKMHAEAQWFKNLPYDLRPYAPRYLGQAETVWLASRVAKLAEDAPIVIINIGVVAWMRV